MKNNSFRSFFSNINGPSGNIVFTSFFYSIWLVYELVRTQSFELESFPHRMIGIATLEAYDISLRVTLFYKSVFVFLISFSLFFLAGYLINKKKAFIFKSVEIKLINYGSLIGILFFLFKVLEYDVFYSMELVYHLHKLMLLSLLIRASLFYKTQISINVYSFILLLSFSLYFFVANIYTLTGAIYNPDFFIVNFICSILLVLLVLVITKNLNENEAEIVIGKIAYVLIPLNFLPIVSILKDELFFILNNNNWKITTNLYIFLSLILLLLVVVVIRQYSSRKLIQVSTSKLLSHNYFPLFIFSLLAYAYYSHYYYYSDEAFESGNKYLPIMEYKLFGVIPTLEKFNSHLLSDYFFSTIYALINGLGTLNELELYDFMFIPFSCTFLYFLVLFLTRNAFVAAFCILLFPFYTSMLPAGYSFSIPGIIALHLLFTHKQSIKTYIIFFLTIIGMIIWRFDLGYSSMIVMPLLVLIYSILNPGFKINWNALLKALGIILGIIILLFSILSVYRGINLFSKALYTLNYFTSAQTYGNIHIGWSNTPTYKMHYFVFPIFVLSILTLLIIHFKRLNVSKNQRLAFLSLIYICAYYLVNFNRGLIRHSLMEWTDEFTSSFIYVILMGSIFVFFHKQNLVQKFIIFCLVIFFSILNYKLPETSNSLSMAEFSIRKIQREPMDTLNLIQNRIKGGLPLKEGKNKDFLQFIQNNTKQSETFIDFTCHSILYFYTQKITPSFFYQNPFCTHNEFLQKHFLDDLNKYEAPYLIFSKIDNRDNTGNDYVPTSLRHYRMAEYFYQNYEPHRIADNYRIWKKIGFKDSTEIKTLLNYVKSEGSKSHLQIKTFKKNNSKKYLITFSFSKDTTFNLKITNHIDTLSANFIKLNSTQYCYVLENNWSEFEVLLEDLPIACESFSIQECDYLPDFYANCFYEFNFRKLPYIWGNYDAELQNEVALFNIDIKTNMKKDSLFTFTIPFDIDKTSGNTLVLNCINKSKFPQNMTLYFGNTECVNKSKINFTILPSETEKKYAIRVSSIYKWYARDVNSLQLQTDSTQNIFIRNILISKGS